MSIYTIIQTITVAILGGLCYQKYFLSLNLYMLFLYLLVMSFMHYKSVDKKNIVHMSWMTICTALSVYIDNYQLQILFVALAPLSYVAQLFKDKEQKIFRWIQSLNIIMFLIAMWLFATQQTNIAYIIAITALLLRQGQFPFYMWYREVKHYREMFPTMLYFTILQTGFIVYAETSLHTYHSHALDTFIPALTLGTGLLLSVYALREKDSLTKHLLLIMSQACLPLASYHSFSSTSATGGLLFAMTIALSGSIYGLFAFHFFKQKKISTLDKYYSLYRANKNLAAIYFVCGFSLVGLPFTIGYFAEDILFHGIIETSTTLAPLYIIMAALNGYTVFYTFNRLFFGHTQKSWSELFYKKHTRAFIGISTMMVTFGVLFIGGFSSSIERRIERNHQQVLHAQKKMQKSNKKITMSKTTKNKSL